MLDGLTRGTSLLDRLQEQDRSCFLHVTRTVCILEHGKKDVTGQTPSGKTLGEIRVLRVGTGRPRRLLTLLNV